MAILFEVVEEGFSYTQSSPLGRIKLGRAHPDFKCKWERWW
jgi:hypothetical protein